MPRPLNYLTTSSPQKQGRDQERKVRQTDSSDTLVYLREKGVRAKSQEQERRLAKSGFVMPGSGAFWPYKGDVSFEVYLVEAKRTDKKSMSVRGDWLDKIYKEAAAVGKEAGMELEIGKYLVQGVVRRK